MHSPSSMSSHEAAKPPRGADEGRAVSAPALATRLWLPLVLVAAGIAVYANGLSAPFVFDDLPQIVEDPSIREAWPPWDAMRGSNRPVLKLSFALNHAALAKS